MWHIIGMRQVLDAITRLDAMAQQGAGPEDVAAEAEFIATGWWSGRGEPEPGGLARLVGELRCWCAVAAAEYAVTRDRLSRAGLAHDAEYARHRSVAFDHAWTALGSLAGRGA